MHQKISRRVRLIFSISTAIVACTTLVACEVPSAGTGPDPRAQSPVQSASEVASTNLRTLDDHLNAVAARVRGFGGLFIASDGTPTIYLTDIGQRQAATAAIGAIMPGIPNVAGRELRVLEGRFGFDQLKHWQHALQTAALSNHSLRRALVYSGVLESRNVVQFGVTDAESAARLADLAFNIGLPSDGVSVVVTPRPLPATTLSDRVRPTVGGLQILVWKYDTGPWENCSLGVNADDDGGSYLITAAHCSATFGSVDGDTVDQTSTGSDRLGIESIDPAFWTGGACPTGYSCRYSDAAAFEYNSSSNATIGAVAKTEYPATPNSWGTSGSNTIAGTFSVTGTALSYWYVEGQSVHKVGYQTGWTTGDIGSLNDEGFDGTCVTEYHYPSSGKALLCQYRAVVYSIDGDSGAPVFIIDGDYVWLAGILWGSAGTTLSLFSPMNDLLSELGMVPGDVIGGGI